MTKFELFLYISGTEHQITAGRLICFGAVATNPND